MIQNIFWLNTTFNYAIFYYANVWSIFFHLPRNQNRISSRQIPLETTDAFIVIFRPISRDMITWRELQIMSNHYKIEKINKMLLKYKTVIL